MSTYGSLRAVLATGALLAVLLAGGGAQAKDGGVGWQAPVNVTVSTGLTDQFLHYACPGNLNVVSGAYFAVGSVTTGNGFIITGEGPRLDESPANYNEWAWNFEWPNGGAPAGSQIIVNVNCKKGAP